MANGDPGLTRLKIWMLTSSKWTSSVTYLASTSTREQQGADLLGSVRVGLPLDCQYFSLTSNLTEDALREYSGANPNEDQTVIQPYVLASHVRPDTPPPELNDDGVFDA